MKSGPQATLIIDGYNLLHAAGLARPTYGPGDLQKARDRLLSLLSSHLNDRQRPRTIVVFDAKESVTFHGSESKYESIRVVFPDRGTEADEVIEQLVRDHSAPKTLRVISSDRRVQRAAQKRRAGAIQSGRFLANLRRGRETEPVPEKPAEGSVDRTDLDHWVREITDEFGVRRPGQDSS